MTQPQSSARAVGTQHRVLAVKYHGRGAGVGPAQWLRAPLELSWRVPPLRAILSLPQFPPLQNGGHTRTCFIRLL